MSQAFGPTIAVVIPNRNDVRHLPKCLRSVLDQPVPPDELIVVDDQSTDDSVRVIRSILSGVRFAQLVENPVNLGTYGAVDEALTRCQSEYALFLSANDFVLPGIFQRAKAALARAPGAALWSAMAWLVDEHDVPIRLHNAPVPALRDAFFTPGECRRLAHRLGSWFAGPTLIYHRALLEEAGRFDAAYGGLSDLLAAMTVASLHGAAYSPEPLAAIRMHGAGNLSRTLSDPQRLEAILERLTQRGPLVAPDLFTPKFLQRTALRFRFSAARASAGRTVPVSMRRLRVARAFVALRPFDLWPTLWYRVLAWALVRVRASPPRCGHGRAG